MSDAVTDTNDSGSTDQTTGDDSSSSGSGDASLWESRFKGLNAKYGEEKTQFTATAKENETLKQQIADLQSGVVNADAAAQAKVKQAEEALAAERQARQIDTLKARFPETFEVFGDAAAGFTPETLAASEARLGGGESPEDDPTPRKHNESRSGQTKGKTDADKTAADVEAELLSMPAPFSWGNG